MLELTAGIVAFILGLRLEAWQNLLIDYEDRQSLVKVLLLVSAILRPMPDSVGNADCLYFIGILSDLTDLPPRPMML